MDVPRAAVRADSSFALGSGHIMCSLQLSEWFLTTHAPGASVPIMTTGQLARRAFLGGMAGVVAVLAAGGCASMASSAQPVPKFAYVGSYTTKERNARGEGINVYRIDPATGAWTHVQLVKDLVNPSWLTLDRQQHTLYSAHGDGEVVTAFRIDEQTGQLSPL